MILEISHNPLRVCVYIHTHRYIDIDAYIQNYSHKRCRVICVYI